MNHATSAPQRARRSLLLGLVAAACAAPAVHADT